MQQQQHNILIIFKGYPNTMGIIDWFLGGETKERYMQYGFTQDQARAMAWICRQKAQGKFWGATTGLFLAFSWGHYHHRVLSHFRLSFNPRLTQLGIIMGSILFFDYLYTGRRRGANQLLANKLQFNNNLFLTNIGSLVDHFDIFTRRFSQEQVEALNFRRNLLKTNHHEIKNKKWIYNPSVYTPEQFQKRIKMATEAPWNQIKEYSSKYGKEVISGPVNIGKLIDQTGDRLGITQKFIYGWSTIH